MKKDKKKFNYFIDFLIKGFVKNINFMKCKQIRYQFIKASKPKLIKILLEINSLFNWWMIKVHVGTMTQSSGE